MDNDQLGDNWASASDRIRWLLARRHGGSRSAMAKDTGVSLTSLIKVVTDQQEPGRRLMETIIRNTDVSPAWLFAGEGQPFRNSGIPVFAKCPNGPPADSEPDLVAGGLPELNELYSPTRYWLKLGASEPAVKVTGNKLNPGDLLLMETKRGKFPPVELLDRRWGVARVKGRGKATARLAAFVYSGATQEEPAFLEAETFDRHPEKVRRIVLDRHPDGEWKISERQVWLEQQKEEDAGKSGRKPAAASIIPHVISYEDVLAVCVMIARTFR